MGFERPGKQFTLAFEEARYNGLVVKMGFLTTGQFLEVTGLASAVQQDDLAKQAAEVRQLIEITASRLVSWNLEDLGQPVPATVAGLMDQDFGFVMDIVTAWLSAIAGVSPPLPGSSSAGGKSPEGSIPMEPLSPSPPS